MFRKLGIYACPRVSFHMKTNPTSSFCRIIRSLYFSLVLRQSHVLLRNNMYIYTALELYLYFFSKLTRVHGHINLEKTLMLLLMLL